MPRPTTTSRTGRIRRAWLACLLAITCLAACWTARGAINAMRLGARHLSGESQISFRVYSARATRLEVYLYDTPTGAEATGHYEMTRDANGVWSTVIPAPALVRANGQPGAVYYGYRAWGPNWPYDPAWRPGSGAGFIGDVDADGNRFDPNKLLLDPYALEVSHDPITPSHQDRTTYASGAYYRKVDSAPYAPKGIVLPALGTGETVTGRKPETALKDDIIYEVHLRGFTKADAGIPENLRGTYSGAALKASYLAGLGVSESGVGSLIRAVYHLLGLRTYLTTGEQETRAWTIHIGDKAPAAAGVIHSDFERGFIAAECTAYDDLIKLGSFAKAREAGRLRIEGKEYTVLDGDVMEFRFNV